MNNIINKNYLFSLNLIEEFKTPNNKKKRNPIFSAKALPKDENTEKDDINTINNNLNISSVEKLLLLILLNNLMKNKLSNKSKVLAGTIPSFCVIVKK